jgi:hypothetical protein
MNLSAQELQTLHRSLLVAYEYYNDNDRPLDQVLRSRVALLAQKVAAEADRRVPAELFRRQLGLSERKHRTMDLAE